MNSHDGHSFHQIYGEVRRRTAYKRKDLVDYTIMSALCMLAVYLAYGPDNPITKIAMVLSLWMVIAFPVRHGWEMAVPLVLRKPQEILHMVLYKIRNLKWMYAFGLVLLLLENYAIYLTPGLPHHTELMHSIALGLFYFHLISITAYRTYILYVHLREKAHVREVLLQTAWKRKLEEQPNMVVEILHAYFTGLLTHIILIAPWFIVITYAKFSILFLPVVCAINVFTQGRWLKALNAWYYRDHWLSHTSETEFVYLHGSHHDAIPTGLIGVAGNGLLEGLTRHGLGAPTPFFNPLISTFIYSLEVKGDIDSHQYIPGLYPKADIERQKVAQHAMHHFGRLQPFSFGMSVEQPGANPEYVRKLKYLPEELKNSIRIDEQLDGFQWNNRMHAEYLELVSRYEKSEQSSVTKLSITKAT